MGNSRTFHVLILINEIAENAGLELLGEGKLSFVVTFYVKNLETKLRKSAC